MMSGTFSVVTDPQCPPLAVTEGLAVPTYRGSKAMYHCLGEDRRLDNGRQTDMTSCVAKEGLAVWTKLPTDCRRKRNQYIIAAKFNSILTSFSATTVPVMIIKEDRLEEMFA